MPPCPFCSAEIAPDRSVSAKTWLVGCTECFNPVVLDVSEGEPKARAPKDGRDVRQVAAEGSFGRALLDRLAPAVDNLPAFPAIAHRATSLAADPESSVQDLAELVRQDQVIAMRILRYANSALYGGLSEIKSIGAACARLGMKKVVEVVQTAGAGSLYEMPRAEYRDRAQRLWRHAVASAHSASAVAAQLAEPNTGMVFAAGLIHDVGKLVLLKVVSEAEDEALEPLKAGDDLLCEVLAGFNALFGLHTVQKWGLPAEFAVTTYYHEDPPRAPGESWRTRVHIVALASAIAEASGYGLEEPDDISLVGHPSARFLGLNDVKLATIRVDLEDKVAALLEVGAETHPH